MERALVKGHVVFVCPGYGVKACVSIGSYGINAVYSYVRGQYSVQFMKHPVRILRLLQIKMGYHL